MKSKSIGALVAMFLAVTANAQQYTIEPTTNGQAVVHYTNNFFVGVNTLEGRVEPKGNKWVPLKNFYTTGRIGETTLDLPEGYSTLRLKGLALPSVKVFGRLGKVYGNINTVGGTGPAPTGTNLWRPEFEGAYATNVTFSNPRAAVTDDAGNIYVVEQDSHAVSVIDTNGILHTAIGATDEFGRRVPGFIAIAGGAEIPGTLLPLDHPSGLFYQNGYLYVLDAGNGRVVRYRDGLVASLFSESPIFGLTTVITNGGGLWVSSDEREAYYTAGQELRHWDFEDGINIIPASFVNLSTVTVDENNDIIVVDKGDNRVYEVRDDTGRKTVKAGSGFPKGSQVGDVKRVSINGPSSIFYTPFGGYLIGSDFGAKVWYVDADDNAATFVFGKAGAHDGDGAAFRKGGRKPKISHVQSVVMSAQGDIIILEDGYVRKIEFLHRKN